MDFKESGRACETLASILHGLQYWQKNFSLIKGWANASNNVSKLLAK